MSRDVPAASDHVAVSPTQVVDEPDPGSAATQTTPSPTATTVAPLDGPDRVVLAQPRVLAWVTALFVLLPLLAVPAIPAAAVVALVPLLLVVWILRSQVVLDSVGVHVRGLTGTQVVPWEQVAGFELRFRGRLRSPVQLQRTVGGPVPLPTVSRDDLPLVAGQAARLGSA